MVEENVQDNVISNDEELNDAKSKEVQSKGGSALFLVLAAIALFAYLPYSGSGQNENISSSSYTGYLGQEKSLRQDVLPEASSLTAYPIEIQNVITLMITENNVDIGEILFDVFSVNEEGDVLPETKNASVQVFHPYGGAAKPFETTHTFLRDSESSPQDWIFTRDFKVADLGDEKKQLIALLVDVHPALCRQFNETFGIAGRSVDEDGIPPVSGLLSFPNSSNNETLSKTTKTPSSQKPVLLNGIFSGQPFGCFDTNDMAVPSAENPLIYYHVIDF